MKELLVTKYIGKGFWIVNIIFTFIGLILIYDAYILDNLIRVILGTIVLFVVFKSIATYKDKKIIRVCDYKEIKEEIK